MSAPPSPCAAPGCTAPSVYRTRTRPSWCDEHITEILRSAGLEPLEPFTTPKAWRLTRCLTCGCEAHYRFEYVLDRNAADEATCRACHWLGWAAETRRLQGFHANVTHTPAGEARAYAEKHEYDYLGALTNPSLPDDPHHVRCRHCGKLSAERLGDVGWGCSCQRNPARDTTAPTGATGKPKRRLLKDSDLDVVQWWDHDANDEALWATVTVAARREVTWRCPDCDLRFTARVLDMAARPTCPTCAAQRKDQWKELLALYKQTPVVDVPELMAAWADDADPRTVPVTGQWELRRFRCPKGHHPQMSPLSYLQSGCPSCRGLATRDVRLEAAATDGAPPGMRPEIVEQWHPTANDPVQLVTVSPRSRRTFWWRDPLCGHEWQDTPVNREKNQRLRCPVCRTRLDSLAWHFPDLAAEWSPVNPLTAWQVRPSGTTAFVPTWVCARNPAHVWQASLTSRTTGSGCPECRQAGKSNVELDHHEAAIRVFGAAASGRVLRDDVFNHRASWTADVTVQLDGRLLVVEYDGSYWHAGKADIDRAKSLDLLAAGHLVARLREHPLPPLGIDHPRYVELVVHALAPDPDAAMRDVRTWVERAAP